MSSKKRVWDDSYVKYGFTEVVENDEVKAQCMECDFILCNASIKPSELNCHFLSIHDGKGTEIDMIKKKAWFDKKELFLCWGSRLLKAYCGGLV